ncbi:thiamine pyrophosphate-dependent enzyme [Saccharopolyspora shandongensis]|uniref:thiamine pyrophosphate-dependent enzyme n=1 Tax=Saccharopolyspora shandongensis TaxID=418495 RepID=UPI003F4CEA05
MTGAFGEATATELTRPDFAAVAETFGVPAVVTSPESLADDLAAALASGGPRVVVLCGCHARDAEGRGLAQLGAPS